MDFQGMPDIGRKPIGILVESEFLAGPTWMRMWSEGKRLAGLRSQSSGCANVHEVASIACVWAGRVLTDARGLEPKPKKVCLTAAAQLVP